MNDFALQATGCELSSYADDTKLRKVIESVVDCVSLQVELDKFVQWCELNGMLLNGKKCAVISFSRKTANDVRYDYTISGATVDRVSHLRDLGVILDDKLSFTKHYDRIASSGHSVLGFVKRRVKELNDPHVVKRLYCSLVQPLMEYASVVWSPYAEVHKNRIESVQKQFLLFALCRLGFERDRLPSYVNRLLLLDMTTLANRRVLNSALLAFDLLRGNLVLTPLSERIVVNRVSYNTRNRNYLRSEQHRVDYAKFEPVSAAIDNFNAFSYLYDPFITRDTFKNRMTKQMKTLYTH